MMKNRIISFVLALTLVVSALLGTTVFASAEGSSAEYKGTSLNLAENITVKVQVAIEAPAEGDYAKATIGDNVISTVPVQSLVRYGNDYLIEAEVAVKDFAKDVKFEICSADGTAYFEKVTSAKAYCESYKENIQDGEFAPLIDALVEYADAADRYFDSTKAAAASVSFDVSQIPDMERKGTMPAGIAHTGATLILESETTVRHYFELADGKFIENYKFFLDLDDDGEYDLSEKLAVNEKVNEDGSVVYYVDIDGITPNELDIAYVVGVYGVADDKTYTCSYGALTYVKSKSTSSKAKLKNLVATLYNYNKEASFLTGTVTFNANGGSDVVTELVDYKYGIETPVVATTAKENAVFLGWTDANGNVVTSIPASATGAVTLTAKWASYENRYDASSITSGAKHYCPDHKDTDETPDGICNKCGYCVNNDACTLVNLAATAKCETCGKAQLALSSSLSGLNTSSSDKGRGYAEKITVDGEEVMLYSLSGNAFYQNFNGASKRSLKDLALQNKVFAVTLEVGLPTEEQYQAIELNPNTDLSNNKDGAFIFRISGGGGTDNVFALSGEKAYISGDSSKYVTVPRGELTKLTIAFDFTGVISGDKTQDFYTIMLFDENGNLVNEKRVGLNQKIYKDNKTGAETTNAKTNNVANELLYTGDISKYASYFFQFRTTGAGRFLLGDIDVIGANPYKTNVVMNATDGTSVMTYTPGVVTPLAAPAEKAGYMFLGWYADADYTQPVVDVPANAVGSFYVYAKWAALGINSDPTYAEGGKYWVTNGACYDIDGDGYCDDEACERCLHKGTLSGTCATCGLTVTNSCKPASHKDEDEDKWCDTCHVLVSGHGTPANSGSLGLTAIPTTGDSIGNGGMVVDNGDEDYIRTHVMGGGPAFSATAGKSIEQLLNESDDMKVTLSIQLAKDSDYKLAGATVRTRFYAMTDHDNNPDTADQSKAFTFSFGAIGSDGTFTFAGGTGEGAWDDARTITLLYGTNNFKLTDEIQRLTIVLDFENHTVSYHVDGVLVAAYSNTLVAATYNAETGKHETTTCFKGTASGHALNMRLNNYGVICVGEVFSVAGDATDLLN